MFTSTPPNLNMATHRGTILIIPAGPRDNSLARGMRLPPTGLSTTCREGVLAAIQWRSALWRTANKQSPLKGPDR